MHERERRASLWDLCTAAKRISAGLNRSVRSGKRINCGTGDDPSPLPFPRAGEQPRCVRIFTWMRYDGGTMDLKVVEKEVATWAPEDQDRLAAYLTVLRLQRSPGYAQELTRRLDDRDPANWVSLAEVKEPA
jgi:hypothetical protein